MYDSFYNFSEKPFHINTDPRFLWLGEKHREALANLKYGLVEHNGIVVLTGDIGTGKTTLVNALLDSLDDKVCVAKINHTSLEPDEFLFLTAKTFDPDVAASHKSDLLLFFKNYLKKAHADGRTVLLIVDEAHRLSAEIFEEIRLLTNIEQAGRSLLRVIFVGQPELMPILLSPQCRALCQRITLFYDIQALTCEETALYIQHRLRVSGAEGPLFSTTALTKIHNYTKGNPRMINILCDRALLTGYVKEVALVDSDIIKECAREIDLLRKRATPEFWNKVNRMRSDAVALFLNMQKVGAEMKQRTKRAIDYLSNRRDQLCSRAGLFSQSVFNRSGRLVARHRRGIVMSLTASALTYIVVTWAIHAISVAHEQEGDIAIKRPKTTVERPEPTLADQEQKADALHRDMGIMDAAETVKLSSTPEISMDGTTFGETLLMDKFEALTPDIYSPDANPPDANPPVKATLQEEVDTALAERNFISAIELVEANWDAGAQMRENMAAHYARALVGRAGEIMVQFPSEAEQLLRKAIKAAPGQTQAHLMLGAQYIRAQDFPHAIGVYKQVLKLDSEKADAWFNLGFSYAQTSDYTAAENAFMRAANLKPPYLGKCLFNLAVVQQKLGKRSNSIENLEAAATTGTDNGRALAYLNRLKKGAANTGQERIR
jgi:type II secretory pathway predicted ATPase ExeA/tetratricopeptide (TPR) repeat protein